MSARDNQLRAQHARTIDKQRLRRSGAGEVGGVTVSDPISLDKHGRITFTKEAFLDLLRSMVADPLLIQPGSPEAIRLKLDASMKIVRGALAARPGIEDIRNQNDESLATARMRGLMSPEDKTALTTAATDIATLQTSLAADETQIQSIQASVDEHSGILARLPGTDIGGASFNPLSLQADVEAWCNAARDSLLNAGIWA